MTEHKNKSFWPYGLIIGLASFILFIGYLVYRVSTTDVHLVQEDYYEKELNYENKIQSIKRAAADDFSIEYFPGSNALVLSSDSAKEGDIKGVIYFYRPSNADLDFDLKLNLKDGEQKLSTLELAKGHWRVKIEYEINGEACYKEYSFQN